MNQPKRTLESPTSSEQMMESQREEPVPFQPQPAKFRFNLQAARRSMLSSAESVRSSTSNPPGRL
jgi:hypothetical protein